MGFFSFFFLLPRIKVLLRPVLLGQKAAGCKWAIQALSHAFRVVLEQFQKITIKSYFRTKVP